MKTFFKLKEVLSEGGNAVSGVVRINQENTQATIDKIIKNLLPALKLKKSDIAVLGSAGKKAPATSSGDIDLALSAVTLLKNNGIDTYDDMFEFLTSKIKAQGYSYKETRSLGIVSLAFPIENIDGKQENAYVQLDLMIVKDVKYASWAFYSPHYLDSEFKGLYRNLLNFLVAKNADLNVTKIDPETNTPIEWTRYWITNQDGLIFGAQTNISAKTGKIVKTVRPASDKKTISKDPNVIVKFLYGDKWTANELLTFEATLKAVLAPSFPFASKRKIILKSLSDAIQHEGLPIPEILAKEL